MKIDIKNGRVNIHSGTYSFYSIQSVWNVNGRIYSISDENASAEFDGNSAAMVLETDGLRLELKIEIFSHSARIRAAMHSPEEAEIASITPFSAMINDAENDSLLRVPFDNDDWVRYETNSVREGGRSYGAGCVFGKDHAAAVGVCDFSEWKTGIDLTEGRMSVVCGIADGLTRDVCPHGTIVCRSIAAPEVWIFESSSWQAAMEDYAEKYSELNARLRWDGDTPVGWNSWYAYMKDIDDKKYLANAEFISSLDGYENGYINFDAFWTNLDENTLRKCAETVAGRNMVPGIYLAPFAVWHDEQRLDEPVTDDFGSAAWDGLTWRSILLKDKNGEILPRVDGGLSLDVTHPAVKERMLRALHKLEEMGYKYIKLDFLGHGAREGDFYDKDITTGMQAYNMAMREICMAWHGFISLSIAPVFPGGYGHARRVCCDVFGEFKDSKYLLNALTYGFWLNKRVYEFNDPDHICVDKSRAEAKFRFVSAVIGGTVMLFSSKCENDDERLLMKEFAGKEELTELAKKHMVFRPVERYISDGISKAFVGSCGGNTYIALFNFKETETEFLFSEAADDLDVKTGRAKALYSGTEHEIGADIRFLVAAKDCEIYQL